MKILSLFLFLLCGVCFSVTDDEADQKMREAFVHMQNYNFGEAADALQNLSARQLSQGVDGNTPLVKLCISIIRTNIDRPVALLRDLLKEGVDPNVGDDQGMTPLLRIGYASCKNGCGRNCNKTASQRMLEKHDLHSDLPTEQCRLALAAQYLLEAGARIDLEDDHGETPLSVACRRRSSNLVPLLLKYSPDLARPVSSAREADLEDKEQEEQKEDLEGGIYENLDGVVYAPQPRYPRPQTGYLQEALFSAFFSALGAIPEDGDTPEINKERGATFKMIHAFLDSGVMPTADLLQRLIPGGQGPGYLAVKALLENDSVSLRKLSFSFEI